MMNLKLMPWWGHRDFYSAEGRVESITETRSFLHWFWLQKVAKVTISLSYPENLAKFQDIYDCEIKPPKKIYILSNNLSLKVGDSLNLELGYASPHEQFYGRVSPFIFKFDDGNILWK